MLNDLKCRALAPTDSLYRIADGGSLYLCVRPSGGRSWEFRFKRQGKVRAVVIGQYPQVGLKTARQERDRFKAMLHEGRDPIAQKKLARAEEQQKLQDLKAKRANEKVERASRINFEAVAHSWVENKRELWTPEHADQVEQSLRDHVYPDIGAMALGEITTKDVLVVLDKMVAANKLETARRVMQRLSAIFGHGALHHGAQIHNDPAGLVRKAFFDKVKLARKRPEGKKKNFPCIDPKEAPALLRALREYEGPSVKLLRLIAFTASRTIEARKATWPEFDLEERTWTVPPERMKARKPHIVPLSKQAMELLQGMASERRSSPFLFSHPTKTGKCASENAVLYVLAQVGYKGQMTGHGFRTLFSTICSEGKWPEKLIDFALAHREPDETRAAYMRSTFFAERKKLMQWWADELDRLEASKPEKARAVRRREGDEPARGDGLVR